jgi:hypothetical protein
MIETPGSDMLSDIDPHYVVALAVVVSPLGAMLGEVFIIHLVQDGVRAVWLSILSLMITGTYAISLNL